MDMIDPLQLPMRDGEELSLSDKSCTERNTREKQFRKEQTRRCLTIASTRTLSQIQGTMKYTILRPPRIVYPTPKSPRPRLACELPGSSR